MNKNQPHLKFNYLIKIDMKAKSIKGNSREEIKSALEQSMADGFTPTLAIGFISVSQDRKAICNLLTEKNVAIFGANHQWRIYR